jgi:hypothetical protein
MLDSGGENGEGRKAMIHETNRVVRGALRRWC